VNKPSTIIRIGAAHYDARTTYDGQTAVVDIAELVKGHPPRERSHKLAALAEMLCDIHGIRPPLGSYWRDGSRKRPARFTHHSPHHTRPVTIGATL
jgi:hypothetical protein